MTNYSKGIAVAGVTLVLLSGTALFLAQGNNLFVDAAQAQHGGGGGSGGGGGGAGGGGGGSGGGAGGHSGGAGGHSGGDGGQGGGNSAHSTGDETTSDGRGPKYGQPDGARSKPVWAQEGIPEVELGRLNVIRAPGNILDRAREELIGGSFNVASIDYYNMDALELAELLKTDWDTVSAVMIDSPLENLAVLRDAINGVSTLQGVTVDLDLMAITLGMASDKNVPVTEDTVIAVVTIFGGDLEAFDIETLAEKAEAIRAAALAGHG